MTKMQGQRVDLLMYFRSVPLFLRHLSVMVAPLLAAVVSLGLNYLGQTLTDPMGGVGSGIYSMIAQLVFMAAFGVAIVQASNAWRGRTGSFDAAWDDAKPKIGNIFLAALGFQFVVYVASIVGNFFGGIGTLILSIIAYIFLIYAIPAAAIGGLPGAAALSASIRTVRAQPLAAIVLGIVFAAIWTLLPEYVLPLLAPYLPPFGLTLAFALVNAISLGYLAFPFAKQYDEVAFRAFW